MISIIGIIIPILTALLLWFFTDINENNELMLLLLIIIVTFVSITLIVYIQFKLIEPLLDSNSSFKEYIKIKDKTLLPNKLDNNIEQMLKRLRDSIELVETLHQDRRDIHHIVSTELREKITGIINYCQIITNNSSNYDSLEVKDKITSISKDLISLIDSVEGILNLDEIKITKSLIESIELRSFMNSIKEDFADEIHKKKLSVELVGDIKLIKGKEALLKQVFSSLIGNAIKYSNSGGNILIDSEKVDDQVVIKIKDNGIGFNPENKELLFDQFTNVRKRGTDGEKTTGVDLFITRKILDKHSGSIEAKSDGEGKGAEFIVKLPI